MTSSVLCTVLLLCVLDFGSSQIKSCKGRCGGEYLRGGACQCDYSCLVYKECCKDYESKCTTKDSCKGRCGEPFKRGRLCSCDTDCMKYGQCCSDFELHCDTEEPTLMTTELSSMYSEANNADDPSMSLNSPTSIPADDPSGDSLSNTLPSEDTANNGGGDAEASAVGSEPTEAAHAAELPTETVTVFSQAGTSPSDDAKLVTVQPTTTEATTMSTAAAAATEAEVAEAAAEAATEAATAAAATEVAEAATAAEAEVAALAATEATTEAVAEVTETATAATEAATEAAAEVTEAATAAAEAAAEVTEAATAAVEAATEAAAEATDNASTQPASPSEPQIELTTPSSPPVGGTVVQVETQSAGTSFPSDEPEVTNTLSSTHDSVTVLENSQVTTTAAASTSPPSTPDPTPIPEKTTSNPDTDSNSGDVATVSQTLPANPEGPPTAAIQDGTADDATPSVTTAAPPKVPPKPNSPQNTEPTSKPQDNKPDPDKPSPVKRNPKPEAKPLDATQTPNKDDPKDYQADESKDTNLCNGQPIGGATTLRNGTVVVFRGHYFWLLDSNKVPGPARGITQVWGVPSPIDTVFTRCNCQGKTYIFKGGRYWRFENDVLDPGYPRAVQTGFDGLQGHITAALSVPQHKRRGESVYFFKRGGAVQKYSYQFGTSPSCGKKVQYAVYTVRKRLARQAVSVLGPTINIQTSWRGFPTTITAAVSIPSSTEPEGYKYYVFSRSKSYQVRMDGERPVVSPPKDNTSPHDSVFKCPKKVQTV